MNLNLAILLLALGLQSVYASNSVLYEKHTLYKLTPDAASQIDFLRTLTEAYPDKLNVWNELERGLVQPVNIMVKPEFKQSFEKQLSVQNIPFEITIENIGQTIQEQMGHLSRAKLKRIFHLKSVSANGTKQEVPLKDFDYSVYHELAEIETWIDQIGQAYADRVQVINVSRSYEGRTIRGFKISVPSSTKKKAIWFDGGIHSREWVSPATVIYMTNELLSKYGADASVTAFLDAFDVYSVPVVNVDGYVYTWTKERLWRKTRSPTPNSTCVGADPNRNWDSHFCEEGASRDPCLETFCGQSAFSEIEVKLLADYIRKNKDDIVAYLNIHAYSQLWMSPYGYADKKPVHFKYMNEGGRIATEALSEVYGTIFEYGPISQIIYKASGSSADWTYDSLGIVFSYGIELRDNGTYGFILPPDQIIPTANETFEGLKALAVYIKSDPMKSGASLTRKIGPFWQVLMCLAVLISVKYF